MKKIILIAFAFVYSTGLQAQIVTPAIDPGLPVELAAASAWRYGSTIGFAMNAGTRGDTKDTSSLEDLSAVGGSGLLAYQPTHVTVELYADSNASDYAWDASSDTVVDQETSNLRFGLAIRGENAVSVGIGMETTSKKIADVEHQSSSYGGSFGMRLSEGIFIAGGMSQGSTTVSRATETISIDPLQWQRIYGGVAMQSGDPTDTMFRMEGAVIMSDSASVTNLTRTEYHPSEMITQGSIEFMTSSYLATATRRETEETILNSTQTETIDKLGIGYRTIGFSMVLYNHTINQVVAGQSYKTQKIILTLSYSFM